MLAATMEKGEGGHFFVPIWALLWSLHGWGRLQQYLTVPSSLHIPGTEEGHCAGALGKWIVGYVREDVWCTISLKTPSYFADGSRL
jgi:hypothetical protein